MPHRPHSGDCTIGSQAAEAQQYPHQHRHRDGEAEHIGQHQQKDLGYAAQRRAVARGYLQQLAHVLHVEDKGEKRAPEKSVREHFFPYIAGENAHSSV